MNRETIEIVTPVEKHVIVLNSYITGREKRALQNVYLEGDVSFDAEAKRVGGMKMDVLTNKATDLTWQFVIVSFDGKKDGENDFSIKEAVLDLRQKDYDCLVAAVNGVTTDAEFEKKS